VKKTSVLMVCRQNICRSPMAEGLLKHRLKEAGLEKLVKVGSAGTHGDMQGSRADERACKVSLNCGVDIGRNKARKIKPRDFLKFDHILVMDQSNYQDLLQQCPPGCVEKLALVMSFTHEDLGTDVPDPYYGNVAGFEKVFDLLGGAVDGFVAYLIKNSKHSAVTY